MKLLQKLNAIGTAVENWIDTLGGQAQDEETIVAQEKPKEKDDMCNSLKHSHWADKAPIKVGEEFPGDTLIEVEKDNEIVAVVGGVIWNGFSKVEKLEDWKAGGWLPAKLYVDGYTESGQDFMVSAGHTIEAVVLERKNYHLNIITRPAETEEEKAIHGRWPKTERISR